MKNHTPTMQTKAEYELVEAIRDILNGLYALRDSAQANGMKAEVEQRLINIGVKAINQAEKA